MPRPTNNSAHVVNTSIFPEKSIILHDSLSSYQMESKNSQCFPISTGQPQPFVQPMFMPYIEEPMMDWTVNNSLHHRFLKLELKCEKILDWELAMLPESKSPRKS